VLRLSYSRRLIRRARVSDARHGGRRSPLPRRMTATVSILLSLSKLLVDIAVVAVTQRARSRNSLPVLAALRLCSLRTNFKLYQSCMQFIGLSFFFNPTVSALIGVITSPTRYVKVLVATNVAVWKVLASLYYRGRSRRLHDCR
jgi:hypothetical protein